MSGGIQLSGGFIQFGDGEPIPATDIVFEWTIEPEPPVSDFANSRTIPGEVIRGEVEARYPEVTATRKETT